MKKFWWVVLNIFTLGIPYAYAKHKAKKFATNVNNQLTVSKEIDINVDDFINDLGSKENIVKITSTISTIKIDLKDASIVTNEKFKKYKIKGLMKNDNQVIFVFGDNSQAIEKVIQSKLN